MKKKSTKKNVKEKVQLCPILCDDDVEQLKDNNAEITAVCAACGACPTMC